MSVFWVELDAQEGVIELATGGSRPRLVRLIVDSPIDGGPGEVLEVVMRDDMMIGDHLTVRRATEAGTNYVVRRDAIAIPASRILNIRNYAFRLIEEVEE